MQISILAQSDHYQLVWLSLFLIFLYAVFHLSEIAPLYYVVLTVLELIV